MLRFAWSRAALSGLPLSTRGSGSRYKVIGMTAEQEQVRRAWPGLAALAWRRPASCTTTVDGIYIHLCDRPAGQLPLAVTACSGGSAARMRMPLPVRHASPLCRSLCCASGSSLPAWQTGTRCVTDEHGRQ